MGDRLIKEKVEELCRNQAFIKKMQSCETAEEVSALFNEYGIDVSPEELEKDLEKVETEKSELTEESLDKVAGGFFISGTAFLVGACWYAGAAIYSAWALSKLKKKKK